MTNHESATMPNPVLIAWGLLFPIINTLPGTKSLLKKKEILFHAYNTSMIQQVAVNVFVNEWEALENAYNQYRTDNDLSTDAGLKETLQSLKYAMCLSLKSSITARSFLVNYGVDEDLRTNMQDKIELAKELLSRIDQANVVSFGKDKKLPNHDYSWVDDADFKGNDWLDMEKGIYGKSFDQIYDGDGVEIKDFTVGTAFYDIDDFDDDSIDEFLAVGFDEDRNLYLEMYERWTPSYVLKDRYVLQGVSVIPDSWLSSNAEGVTKNFMDVFKYDNGGIHIGIESSSENSAIVNYVSHGFTSVYYSGGKFIEDCSVAKSGGDDNSESSKWYGLSWDNPFINAWLNCAFPAGKR